MRERICVVVNPAAGRGRGARLIPEISARFGEIGGCEIQITKQKGDEAAVAADAIARGFTTIVAVGGDGTTSNVANAILRSGASVRLAVVPAGTGNDFAKVLGTSKADVVAQLCARDSDVRVDAGRIDDVFFVNCCGFGFDVAVLEEIGRTPWLRGSSVYLYTALRQLFSFHGIDVAIASPKEKRPARLHMLLVVVNTEYFGGTFMIAPGAKATDGMLDAVSILDISPARRMAMLAAATRGTHLKFPECIIERSATFELHFGEAPSYETDGELHHAQARSLTVSSCPSALRVVAGPTFRG